MTTLRSYVFLVLASIWTFGTGFLYLPLLAGPYRLHRSAVHLWSRGIMALLAVVCDLRFRVEGRENIPTGPAIVAAKHQSAWETVALNFVLQKPVFILKKELLWIPLIGWHFQKAGCIAIDRSMGVQAIRAMVPATKVALAKGRQVIVFPEGTRVAYGARHEYQPGVAAIYARADAPVVPVALDSGRFWGRRSVMKYPGTVTMVFLPPMPPGLDRRTFMRELETRIETASDRLAEPVAPEARADARAAAEPAAGPEQKENTRH